MLKRWYYKKGDSVESRCEKCGRITIFQPDSKPSHFFCSGCKTKQTILIDTSLENVRKECYRSNTSDRELEIQEEKEQERERKIMTRRKPSREGKGKKR